jgi:hypothetical protein
MCPGVFQGPHSCGSWVLLLFCGACLGALEVFTLGLDMFALGCITCCCGAHAWGTLVRVLVVSHQIAVQAATAAWLGTTCSSLMAACWLVCCISTDGVLGTWQAAAAAVPHGPAAALCCGRPGRSNLQPSTCGPGVHTIRCTRNDKSACDGHTTFQHMRRPATLSLPDNSFGVCWAVSHICCPAHAMCGTPLTS